MYFQYISISFSRISACILTIYTLILPSSRLPVRNFFLIVLLDTPLPYVGVSVGTVTHEQGLELKHLQEKTFTGLIVQILGVENQKMPS
jgi:hypothetical protein